MTEPASSTKYPTVPGLRLQIPPSPLRAHFVRAKVRLHEYPDGAVALFWEPHRIAYFAPNGNPRQLNQAA